MSKWLKTVTGDLEGLLNVKMYFDSKSFTLDVIINLRISQTGRFLAIIPSREQVWMGKTCDHNCTPLHIPY